MMLPLAPWLSSLVVASLKGSVILVAALLLVRAMRRSSAEARHAMLAIALVAFLAVPLATALAPTWIPIALPAVPGVLRAPEHEAARGSVRSDDPDSSPHAAAGGADRGSAPAQPSSPASTTMAASATAPAPAPSSAGATTTEPAPFALPPLRDLLLVAWLAGASLVALRLLLGIVRLRVLSRRATMVTDGGWLQTAHGIARRLGLTRGVTLLRGDRDAVPMTWGVLSPVVWLPPAADTWPVELRSSVLSHELAHVRRRDAMTQWLANVVVALHWFNPLVWIATRALRSERERACDDAVLALGAAPDDYAEHLLGMVRALGATGGPAPAMAMARRSQFEGRLLAILDRACSRGRVGRARLAAAGAGALALVFLLGGVRSTEAARVEGVPAELRLQVFTPIMASAAAAAPAAPSARVRPPQALLRDTPVRPAASVSVSPPSPAIAAKEITLPAPILPRVEDPAPPAPTILAAVHAAPLARSDTTLLLDVIAAAEGISSSTDRTAVLERVARLPDLAPRVVAALGNSAKRVTSSSARARLLRTVVSTQPHAVGESRRPVLDALSGDMISADMASVLELFVRRDSVEDAALADAFIATARMTSSSEKTRVLIAAVKHRKPEGVARAAYIKAAGSITNSADRARVLASLLDEPDRPASPPAH